MDINNAASVIKDTVDMETVIGLYGYEAKHGKMVCPFHADKNASLQIYRNSGRHSGWHCFGCGKGGSVIDFVMEHEGCDFVTAVKAIDQALGLRLTEVRDLFETKQRKQEQKLYDMIRESFDSYYTSARDVLEGLWRETFSYLQAVEEIPKDERTDADNELISIWEDRLQYIDYLQDLTDEGKRKVMLWRNQARRARSG